MDEATTWAWAELGLAPGADGATVKRAFRQLARQRHPDHGGDRLAFERLVAAAEVLRDVAPEAPQATAAPSGRRRPANPYASFLVELDEADRAEVVPAPPARRPRGGPSAAEVAAPRAASFAEVLASVVAAA